MKYPKTTNLILRIIFLMILTFIGLKMPNFTAGLSIYLSGLAVYEIWTIIMHIKYSREDKHEKIIN